MGDGNVSLPTPPDEKLKGAKNEANNARIMCIIGFIFGMARYHALTANVPLDCEVTELSLSVCCMQVHLSICSESTTQE